MEYSQSFKNAMVKRMLNGGNKHRRALADEVGVHPSTLSRWVRESGKTGIMTRKTIKSQNLRPDDKTPEDKFQLIVEASQLSDEKLGDFLRKNGIHEAQLEQWKLEALGGLSKHSHKPLPRAKNMSDTKKMKTLEKDLRRKDKALAEAAALLILKKKVEALWGDEDDDIQKWSGQK